MSSYLVSDKTVNAILAGLQHASRDGGLHLPQPTGQLAIIATSKECAALGAELRAMNRRAVVARYGADDEMAAAPPTYRYRQEIPVRRIQLYKSLRCLLFQCDEGTAPAGPLFKALVDFYDQLAHFIITDLPEYEQARWDL